MRHHQGLRPHLKGDLVTSDPTRSIPTEKPPVKSVERPWGSFKQYAHNQPCTVSIMTVLPGQRLSLQSHTGRAELWIVIDDGALVQVGETSRRYQPGDEIWIKANEKHRLSCAGDKPVRVLEVAFGDWQQDDIKRYEDDYHR
jgi:mannose-6-phosphate isomerase